MCSELGKIFLVSGSISGRGSGDGLVEGAVVFDLNVMVTIPATYFMKATNSVVQVCS